MGVGGTDLLVCVSGLGVGIWCHKTVCPLMWWEAVQGDKAFLVLTRNIYHGVTLWKNESKDSDNMSLLVIE